jgi:hypothetical protein
MKNYLAIMALMAVVGGDAVYGMKPTANNDDQSENNNKKRKLDEISSSPEVDQQNKNKQRKLESPMPAEKKIEAKKPEEIRQEFENPDQKIVPFAIEEILKEKNAIPKLVKILNDKDTKISENNQEINNLKKAAQKAWWDPTPSATEFFMAVAAGLVTFSLNGHDTDYLFIPAGTVCATRFLVAKASVVYNALFKAKPQVKPQVKPQEENDDEVIIKDESF